MQMLKFLCLCAVIFCGQIVAASDWALVPYPKQIETTNGIFVFADTLELRVTETEKEQALLGQIILEELQRAKLPLPKIVPVKTGNETNNPQLIICPPQETPAIPDLPKNIGENKIDAGESYFPLFVKGVVVVLEIFQRLV